MIGSESELRARFGEVHPLAIQKSRPTLDKHSRQFIAMSPFLVISTANAEGKADVSPRGDPPGFVHIVNDRSFVIPDRPATTGLIPCRTSSPIPTWPACSSSRASRTRCGLPARPPSPMTRNLLKHCIVTGKQPKVGILVTVEEVFLHCAKALKRSKLWHDDYRQDRSQMPSIARIILADLRDRRGRGRRIGSGRQRRGRLQDRSLLTAAPPPDGSSSSTASQRRQVFHRPGTAGPCRRSLGSMFRWTVFSTCCRRAT